MGKKLKYKPLSQRIVKDILSSNPEQSSPSSAPAASPAPVLRLYRKSDYDTLQPVDQIRAFLDFARSAVTRYEENERRWQEYDQETQDLLHVIELSDNLNASKGYDMYRRLAAVRRERRQCKNEMDLLKPVYDFFADKQTINQLAQVQGKCRACKETVDSRSYTLRTNVMD